MVDIKTSYATCEYLARKGICGRRCVGVRCYLHRGRESLKPCLECGTPTSSKTGYCSCSMKQVVVGNKLIKLRKDEEKIISELYDDLVGASDEIA